MDSQTARFAGWAAILSGTAAIVAFVSLMLFFALEASDVISGSGQGTHVWGPISDISPIGQMLLLLVVVRPLHALGQQAALRLSVLGAVAGAAGMLGVALLQFLLVVRVLTFDQEVFPVVMATAIVGAWMICANALCLRRGTLPRGLAQIGIAVGAALMLEPLLLAALGGGSSWMTNMSNPVTMAVLSVFFLVAYIGFPLWAFRLGRVLAAAAREPAAARRPAQGGG